MKGIRSVAIAEYCGCRDDRRSSIHLRNGGPSSRGRLQVRPEGRVAIPGMQDLCRLHTAYQGRDPELLARLSQASGLHILTNTGLYGSAGGRYIRDFAFSATAEDLAARWTSEFQAGIPPAGIRPALIKIGVDLDPLSKMNSKLVSAAALTHLRTGLVIASHTGDGVAAMAQLNLVKSHGVSPSAFFPDSERSVL
jgi:phosphotriesterase-related protein